MANDFGNLLNRVSGLIGRYFDGRVPAPGTLREEEKEIQNTGGILHGRVNELIADYHINEAIEETIRLVRMANKYMEAQAPWKVAKDDLAAAGRILYAATEALRIAAVLLGPVMPAKTGAVLEILGAVGSEAKWGQLKPGTPLKSHEALFPRIEVKAP